MDDGGAADATNVAGHTDAGSGYLVPGIAAQDAGHIGYLSDACGANGMAYRLEAALCVGRDVTIEADGETVEVPGKVTTTTSLSGAGAARYVAEQLKTTVEGADLEWDGADVQLTWNSGFTAVDLAGRLEQLRIASPAEGVEILVGPVEMEFQQERTDYGFWVGGGKYLVSEVNIVGPEQFSARDLELSGNVELSGDKTSYTFGMDAASVEVGDWSDGSVAVNVELANLDAEAMGEIHKVLSAAQPGTNWMTLMPELSNFMGALLAGGPELHLKELRVDTPMGQVLVSLNLSLPADQVDNPNNLPGLMMALVGDVSLKFPQALVNMMATKDPQVEAGVQQAMMMGFILEEGSDYIMDAEYQGGLLTVNGNPFPLGNLGM